ncbi:hypothetical protein [Labrenzia sp. DG1229]|nr:hypothetical protein [Labrenzia sp. DG1229]
MGKKNGQTVPREAVLAGNLSVPGATNRQRMFVIPATVKQKAEIR